MFNKSTFALALVAGVFVNVLFVMQSTRADNFLGGDGGSNFGPVIRPDNEREGWDMSFIP